MLYDAAYYLVPDKVTKPYALLARAMEAQGKVGIAHMVDIALSEREMAMATQLVESLSADFEADRFQDTYREAVLGLIERKASGEHVIAPAAEAEPATPLPTTGPTRMGPRPPRRRWIRANRRPERARGALVPFVGGPAARLPPG